MNLFTRARLGLGLFFATTFALTSAGCGGPGGAGIGHTLPGVVLVSFVQASEDNLPLNRILEFVFSSEIDPDTVGQSSIQIRQGPSYGAAVPGKYIVSGTHVFF